MSMPRFEKHIKLKNYEYSFYQFSLMLQKIDQNKKTENNYFSSGIIFTERNNRVSPLLKKAE